MLWTFLISGPEMTDLKHMSRLQENYPQSLSVNQQRWGPGGVVWLSFGSGFLPMDLKYTSESKSSALSVTVEQELSWIRGIVMDSLTLCLMYEEPLEYTFSW